MSEHMDEQDEHSQMWDALVRIGEAAGLIPTVRSTGPSYPELMDIVVPHVIDVVGAIGRQKAQNVDRAADLLAADLQALRAEVKKPLMAIGLIHRIVRGIVRPDNNLDLDTMAERAEAICLWVLLGDDDYLTDEGDRVALLEPKPDASSPSAGTPR